MMNCHVIIIMTYSLSFWLQISEPVTHMDTDDDPIFTVVGHGASEQAAHILDTKLFWRYYIVVGTSHFCLLY